MANYNQNNKEKENVNSRGLQFYNSEADIASTLIIGYWNQTVTLKIHPAKDPSARTKSSVFDYEKSVNLAIPLTIGQNIVYGIEKFIMPAIENRKEATYGFPVGKESALIVSTGAAKFGKIAPYIAICKNIDQKLKSGEKMEYIFNGSRIINGYDGDTPTDTPTSVWNYAEFQHFVIALKEFIKFLTGASYHADRVFNHRYKNEVYGLFKGISEKIGVPFYASSYSSNNNSSNDIGALLDENTNANSNNQIQVDSIEELFPLE